MAAGELTATSLKLQGKQLVCLFDYFLNVKMDPIYFPMSHIFPHNTSASQQDQMFFLVGLFFRYNSQIKLPKSF